MRFNADKKNKYVLTDMNTEDNESMILSMEKAWRCRLMTLSTKESSERIRGMAKGSLRRDLGCRSTKVSSRTGEYMDLEGTSELMAGNTKVTGTGTRSTAMGHTPGKTDDAIKDITSEM